MAKYDASVFGRRVAARRAEVGMKQDDLAKITGITRQQISLYESGECVPSLYYAAKIATALGVTLDSTVTPD